MLVGAGFEAGELPVERLWVENPQTPPDPRMIELQGKMEKMAAETEKVRAEVAKIVQGLDLDEAKKQIAQFTALVEGLNKIGPSALAVAEVVRGESVGAMEGASGNQGVYQDPA